MKRIVVCFLLCVGVFSFPAAAQSSPGESARNALYIDGHPSGTPFVLSEYDRFSINFERLIRPNLSIGVGASLARPTTCPTILSPEQEESCRPLVYRTPLSASWMTTGSSHRAELGPSAIVGYSTGTIHDLGPNGGLLWSLGARVGYRYQPPAGGFSVRAMYQPQFIGPGADLAEFAIGVGYAF